MQNLYSNKKNLRKNQIRDKASKDIAFRETKTGKSISINKIYIYAIIVMFSFILYGNTILNDYALDDEVVITKNKFTQKGINGIQEIFSYDSFKGYNENKTNAVSGGRYRPLSIATFAVEYEFFGLNPHISHFINVLLYSLTCLLIFILLSKLLEKYPHKKWYATIPFIAIILYVAHPVHTEVVANIKSRDEIFSLLFSLLTFWFLWKYLESKKNIFLFYSSGLFFLSLLSKENALLFIVIFPMTFYFFTNHSLKKIISSLIPLFVIIIVFIILRYIIISKSESVPVDLKDIMNNSFGAMNFYQKYATIAYTLGLYLKLLFYPHPLTWDYYPYHIPIMEWSDIFVLLSLMIYLFLLYLSFKGLKSKNFISYSIFLFLIPLSLTSNILFPVGAFMCERFLYVASLGYTMIIAYFIVVKPNNLLKMLFSKPYIFLAPVLLLYSFKTITRNTVWKNSDILFETDIKTSFNSAKSNSFYGKVLYNKADSCKDASEKEKYLDLALQYCDKAFKINPNMHFVNYVLGTIYCKYKNDLNKSIYYLNNAVILNPYDVDAYNNMGFAYFNAKQYDKAIEVFKKALEIAPRNVEVLSNIASAYSNKAENCKDEGERAKFNELALQSCNKSLEINPQDIEVISHFATIFTNIANSCNYPEDKAKYYDLALQLCDKAFKINPNIQLINLDFGIIYIKYKNDFNKSIFYLNNAIKLDSKNILSYKYLGFAYFNAKQNDKTIEVYEKALKIVPQDIEILNNLAAIYKIIGKTGKAAEYSKKAKEIQDNQKNKVSI